MGRQLVSLHCLPNMSAEQRRFMHSVRYAECQNPQASQSGTAE